MHSVFKTNQGFHSFMLPAYIMAMLYADVMTLVGQRLQAEGLATKLFMPEDVGWFDGIKSLVEPVLC